MIKKSKTGRLSFFCNYCEKRMNRGNCYCLDCKKVSEDLEQFVSQTEKKEEDIKIKRIEKQFSEMFDDESYQTIFKMMNEKLDGDGFTLKEAAQNMLDTGKLDWLRDKYASQWTWLSTQEQNEILLEWTWKRLRRFVGKLKRENKCFIGARIGQGHPYLILLPKKENQEITST